jgi:hypothetical protein
MAQDIGLLLRGLGAAVSNQVPQFRQQMAQEQEAQMRQQEYEAQQAQRAQQGRMQNVEMMQARQQATAQDLDAGLKMAARGDWESIIALGEDRMRIDQQLGGSLENDMTPMFVNMARRAAAGDAMAGSMLTSQLAQGVSAMYDRGLLQKPEEAAFTLSPGQSRFIGDKQVASLPAAPSAPSTVVTIGEQGASPELAKNIDQQLAAALDSAGVSASAVPQLEMLMQLAPLTTTGAIPAQISRMFPTFNDANAAFIGITNQVLPSLRVPGSGAQSDKDIDVLLNSIGNLGASTEVKQLTIQSLMAKNAINQERADIAEQVISGELTRAQAVRKLREVSSRSILSPELQGQINRIAGLPQAAKDAGLTLDEWNSMTPAEKNTFK